MKSATTSLWITCCAGVFLGAARDVNPNNKSGTSGVPPIKDVPVTDGERRDAPDRPAEFTDKPGPAIPHEQPSGHPLLPRPTTPPPGSIEHSGPWTRGTFQSVQVNVDSQGNNILGDAANEPSIAIDPTDPNKIVIGWRQFDSVESGFRQAGWAYSHDAGQTWTFAGVLEPGVFSSDPVLDSDGDGNFYYYSLQPDRGPGSFPCYLYKSVDGGVSWLEGVYAYGGDKAWMAIDRTAGIGRGNIYCHWSSCGAPGPDCSGSFTRSADGGATFSDPIAAWAPLGTVTVGPDGTVHVAGGTSTVYTRRSANAQDPDATPFFEPAVSLHLNVRQFFSINGQGLLGQTCIATDHSDGPNRGNVYVLVSAEGPSLTVPPFTRDPYDVMFRRSLNGGASWGSRTMRVNDDPLTGVAFQWFGTMSVAPAGRIDAIWNDTRNDPLAKHSEVYYSYSIDTGVTWSRNIPLTPPFDHTVGYPNGSPKLGDYYHMVSDDGGANLAYAATFNGEQDVYFLRIVADCNGNEIHDGTDLTAGTSADCNANTVLDECDIAEGTSEDCDGNGVPDECENHGDCNGNNNPDVCDIDDGTSRDTNTNGIPDECEAPVLFVDEHAAGLNHGTSWTDAFNDLQKALVIAEAAGGTVQEIWVAAGTYSPAPPGGDRFATFQLANGVALYGGFAGGETSVDHRDPGANLTTLSGDLDRNDPTSNCCNAFSTPGCDNPACEAAVCAVRSRCCDSSWDHSCADLAAKTCSLCDGTVNENSYHVVSGSGTDITTVLDGFTITAGNSFGSEDSGGGMITEDGSPTIADCTFVANRASFLGGGMYIRDGSPTVMNSSFIANSADTGGGIFIDRGNPNVVNCRFMANRASSGGGLVIDWSDGSVVNSIFTGNVAGYVGGMVMLRAQPTAINCVFISNTAAQGSGGVSTDGNGPKLKNCILWGNSLDGVVDMEAQIVRSNDSELAYSCVQGLTGPSGGIGNIADDPMFVDADGPDDIPGTVDDDLRLMQGSPCINTGDLAFVAQPGTIDLGGNPRLQGCRVDMGAYESDVTHALGDFDGDDNVNLVDLAGFQVCFDPALSNLAWLDACLCFFDYDGNKTVDLPDFVEFHAAFIAP